jgi:guanylate kinase
MPDSKRYIKGPLLVVISAPSGAGKTTICRELVKRHSNIRMSISATTRPRAKGERSGRDYYFMSRQEFETKMKAGWFVEYAKVYGQYYGTPVSRVEKFLNQNRIVLFDIDTQGGRAVKKAYPDAVTIFILPPSIAELKRRLYGRHRDTQSEIDKRLALALKEIKMRTKYDYTVINSVLDQAISRVESILESESLKSWRFKSSNFS